MIRDDAKNPRSLADGDGGVRHRLSIYRLSDIHNSKTYAGPAEWGRRLESRAARSYDHSSLPVAPVGRVGQGWRLFQTLSLFSSIRKESVKLCHCAQPCPRVHPPAAATSNNRVLWQLASRNPTLTTTSLNWPDFGR